MTGWDFGGCVQGLGSRVKGSECRASGAGRRVKGFEFRVAVSGFWKSGCGFRLRPDFDVSKILNPERPKPDS